MADNVIMFKIPLFNQLIAAIRAGSVEEITRIYFEMYPAEKQPTATTTVAENSPVLREPNEGSTKPTYSELQAENLRVRGLLQRQSEVLQRIASWDFDFYGDCVAEAKKLASDALSRADGE